MLVYIEVDTNCDKSRDDIDHKVTYVSNQFGARIVKKSISDLSDISYKLELDDLDTYTRYAKALARLLNEISCDYVIKAFHKQTSWGAPITVPVFSNYIDSDIDDSDNDMINVRNFQMHPIYTIEYDGHNVY